MIKKWFIALAIVSLFFVSSITSASHLNSTHTTPIINKNKQSDHPLLKDYDIIIPDDYPTIQEGVDNAKIGDKILVRSNVYNENIIIESMDKEGILLQGENKYNTVLDGCKNEGDGILISADNVAIQGFTITNYRKEGLQFWAQAGIKIFSSNVTIKDNRIVENRIGIEIYSQAYNITIEDNELINDGISLGNYFNSEEFPKISELDFIHNINNNTVNGLPLYYYRDEDDFTVPSDAGQIILVNCNNVNIRDIYMSRNDFSIILAYCNTCILENLTISDTDGEVLLYKCENNTIQNNTITNTFKAICLEFGSKNNIVRDNDCSNNLVGISIFLSANNNSIYRNTVNNNEEFGIEIVSYHGGVQQDNDISANKVNKNRVGIYLKQNSIKNIIQNNSITKNRMGIVLQDSSDYNEIKYNTFKWNLLSATFIGCGKNTWYQNYWNRPRLVPKTIKGISKVGKIPIPWINVDWRPARKKLDI